MGTEDGFGTGLVYTQQRYYDPETGGFVSPDPIGFAGGLNLYAYADGDPINNVDPSGLDTEPTFNPKIKDKGKLPGSNTEYRMDLDEDPYPDMHIYWPEGETVINYKGKFTQKFHRGHNTIRPPRSARNPGFWKVVEEFKKRAKWRVKQKQCPPKGKPTKSPETTPFQRLLKWFMGDHQPAYYDGPVIAFDEGGKPIYPKWYRPLTGRGGGKGAEPVTEPATEIELEPIPAW